MTTAAEDRVEDNQTADDMLEAMTLLGEILAEENAALQSFRIAEVEALQAQKRHCVRLYEHNIDVVAGNPEKLTGLGRDDELKEASVALATLIEENERLLKANMEVSTRLLDAIVSAAKGGQSATTLYSREGTTAPAAEGRTVALSLNQTF